MHRIGSSLVILVTAAGIGLSGCGGDSGDAEETTSTPAEADGNTTTTPVEAEARETEEAAPPFSLEIAAFTDGVIPAEFTCDGDNLQPAISIDGAPEDAVELVLIVDDPDAPDGSFIHWVLWGIPTDAQITAGEPPAGSVEGTNDSGGSAWFGPCPPPGSPHNYEFQLAAVSEPVELAPGATAQELRDVISSTIIDSAVLVASYERS